MILIWIKKEIQIGFSEIVFSGIPHQRMVFAASKKRRSIVQSCCGMVRNEPLRILQAIHKLYQIPGFSIIPFIILSSERIQKQDRHSHFQLPPSPSRDLGFRGQPVWACSGAPGTFPKKKKKIGDFQKKLILQRT